MTNMSIGPCRVCALLDYDVSPKQVYWCEACHSWMCAACRGDWWRRAQAVLIGWLAGRA